jgi:thiol-disulfide isomerase/thioredoxin
MAAALNTTTLESIAEIEAVLASGKPVVVKFFAKFCRACKKIGPMYEKASKELGDDFTFYEVALSGKNIQEMSQHFGFDQIPTAIVYSKGDLIQKMTIPPSVFKKFRAELGLIRDRLAGKYVPTNNCGDDYWTCDGAEDEVTTLKECFRYFGIEEE